MKKVVEPTIQRRQTVTQSAPKARTDSRRRVAPQHLGMQIRDLRRIQGLTIAKLAGQIKRSNGYVSQIERGKSSVTISALQEIADALGVQVAWFFQLPQHARADEVGMVVRKADRRRLHFPGAGIEEELLSPSLGAQLELILTTFQPGSTTGDRDRIRRGEEAGYVISGSLDLIVEGKHLRLHEGDSFAFTRKGPHRCINPGKEKAVVLWVITPPSY